MTDADDRARRAEHQPQTAEDVDPDVARLLGLRPEGADAMPDEDEIDRMGEMTDTRVYQGDLEARPPDSDQPDESGRENLESLAADEFRAGETDDPNEAAEEGLTWIPPTDPPLRAGDEGPEIAAGFGTSATDEPFDADHHGQAVSPHDEVETRVLEALRAHAATTGYADRLEIDVEAGVARIAGDVEDVVDEDAIVAVAEDVPGIRRVDSRLVVRAVAETAATRRRAKEGAS